MDEKNPLSKIFKNVCDKFYFYGEDSKLTKLRKMRELFYFQLIKIRYGKFLSMIKKFDIS